MILYTLFPYIVVVAVFLYARSQSFDNGTMGALLVALVLYYFNFYITPLDQLAVDPAPHGDYIKYIATKARLPTREESSAARHPVLYYLIAAAVYKLGQWQGMAEPLMLVRHLSMVFFVGFILISIRFIRLFLSPASVPYYAALGLLLFWPLSVTMGSRITCDILLYMAQAATLFYLTRWFQTKDVSDLTTAFLWAGICALTKSMGGIMVALAGLLLLQEIYKNPADRRRFLRGDLLRSIAFACIACATTAIHERLVSNHTGLLDSINAIHDYDWYYWLRSFLSFNPLLLITDDSVGDSEGMFWNMLVHSFLVGDVLIWKTSVILILFNMCWLGIMLYLLEGILHSCKIETLSGLGRKVVSLFFVYVAITLAMMMAMTVKTGNPLYADARYIYVLVILVTLGQGVVMRRHLEAGRLRYYRAGVGLVCSFIMLTFALFISQYLYTFKFIG